MYTCKFAIGVSWNDFSDIFNICAGASTKLTFIPIVFALIDIYLAFESQLILLSRSGCQESLIDNKCHI